MKLLPRLWDPSNRFLEFWVSVFIDWFSQTHWMHSATWRLRRRCYLTVLFSSPLGARGHFSSRRRESFLPTSEEGTGGEIDACCGRPDASDDWPQKVSGVQDLFISGANILQGSDTSAGYLTVHVDEEGVKRRENRIPYQVGWTSAVLTSSYIITIIIVSNIISRSHLH